jgi:hypothetical protein
VRVTLVRWITFSLLLVLSSCGAPIAVVTAGLGVAAGVLRIDNTLLDAWLAARNEKRVAALAATVKAP